MCSRLVEWDKVITVAVVPTMVILASPRRVVSGIEGMGLLRKPALRARVEPSVWISQVRAREPSGGVRFPPTDVLGGVM